MQAVGTFRLDEGGGQPGKSTLPAPALRDATPRQLANGAKPAASSSKPKKLTHTSSAAGEEEWEEF